MAGERRTLNSEFMIFHAFERDHLSWQHSPLFLILLLRIILFILFLSFFTADMPTFYAREKWDIHMHAHVKIEFAYSLLKMPTFGVVANAVEQTVWGKWHL